jgi:hypothetical protein
MSKVQQFSAPFGHMMAVTAAAPTVISSASPQRAAANVLFSAAPQPAFTPTAHPAPPAKSSGATARSSSGLGALKPPGHTAVPVVQKPVEDMHLGHGSEVVDYTIIPTLLDSKYEAYDKKGEVRATIIKNGLTWYKKSKKGILSPVVDSVLCASNLNAEKCKAFDLIDALTKSGAMKIEDASLHVFIAATHVFDKTVMETVVQDNRNPIEALERTSVVMAATIHGMRVPDVIAPAFQAHFSIYSPHLLEEPEDSASKVAKLG